MAISDRTRRTLWGRAGGRCSICKRQLIVPATQDDDPSVIGEEAHIVAQSPDGPRGDPDYAGDLDQYDNLILLCRTDHKVIDDQIDYWTENRLRSAKKDHEEREAKDPQDIPPIRLIPDPASPPDPLLKFISTGRQLWNILSAALEYAFDYPQDCTEEDLDLVVGNLDAMKDCGEISSDIHSFAQVADVNKSLQELISELAEAGYLIFGRTRYLLLTGGVSAPSVWPRAEITVVRTADLSADQIIIGDEPEGKQRG